MEGETNKGLITRCYCASASFFVEYMLKIDNAYR